MPPLSDVQKDALRDAVAIVACLRKGDQESANLLVSNYDGNGPAMLALYDSFAAFAIACLDKHDEIAQHYNQTDGIRLPSSNQILHSILLGLAAEA